MNEKKIKLAIRNPTSVRQKVHAAIRELLLSGKIKSGERIVETQLAKQIKTSRTPVREALHMLEMEGLIESIPRVGYQVKALKWSEVEEICEIRVVTETLAAKWAMKRMTQADFQAMEDNLVSAHKDVTAGNPRSFVQYDAEFHEILARAGGSQRLLELCQLLRRHMLLYRVESLYVPDSALRGIQGHWKIVEALKDRDENRVSQAMRDHLHQSKSDIYRYAFPESGKEKPAVGTKNA
ncbi:MAG: GntR family transcriptional regulator [Pseudomonadota bacterium]